MKKFRFSYTVIFLILSLSFVSSLVFADPSVATMVPAGFKITYQMVVPGAVVITAVKDPNTKQKVDYSCDWRSVPPETASYMLKVESQTSEQELKNEVAKLNKQLNPMTEITFLGRKNFLGGVICWEKWVGHYAGFVPSGAKPEPDQITYTAKWAGPCKSGYAQLAFSGANSQDTIVKWLNFIVTGKE